MKRHWAYFEILEMATIQTWMQAWKTKAERPGILAFLAEDSQSAVTNLQVCATKTGLSLIGGIFPELIIQARFRQHGLLLIGLDPMPPYRLHSGLSSANGRKTALSGLTELAEGLSDSDNTLFMLFDGLYGQTASFLADLYYELGDTCRYAGVNAGSETFQPMPCLFDNRQFLADAVLSTVLPIPCGAILEHAYPICKKALTATATTGNRITRIDLEPAFDKYVKLVRDYYAEEVSRENFYSMGVHFPFALMRANGECLIRIPVAVDEDGALFCVGEVPEGALLTVARGIEAGNGDAVIKLARQYQDLQARAGLFFYCAGRRMHLSSAASEELSQLASVLPDEPLLGALTLGEIGNSAFGGYPLFHNATLVALPLELAS